ncbi:asparagine synthase (glutamine-hydrolyzing) [Limisalsivibrio acetivorans]|uniref:asparagine synthase (glutamine-hydrolyzing) n=1 Tax=Limisalsivibrio acetivorans TaxID=1304888 RepID=UPI0003B3E2B2|nr:asparagine synthase (glutamine-hydrolyzing) [Limisalsivibrio acetivorans]
MCGIIGGNVPPEKILSGSSRLRHRGPDASGYIQFSDVTLAHRRLSVIDLSEKANQPMTKDNYSIIFNGEIFNFQELRRKLEGYGAVFETLSDTEVILEAYRKWGSASLNLLNGDFAFCILDRERRKLFLARDRLGNKPLYYTKTQNGEFFFASELQAFRGVVPTIIDEQKAGNIIVFSINDNDERTLLKGVYNLPPGHFMEYSIESGALSSMSYWELEEEIRNEDETDLLDEFHELLEDAVRLRLIADVPVGCLVSGGLDSSVIAMHIANLGGNIKCFSSVYDNHPEIDEKRYVTKLGESLGLNITFIHPDVSGRQDFRRIAEIQGDLFRSFSIFAQYETIRRASEEVTVVLGGQGADELFGGYYHHCARFLARRPEEFENRKKLYGATYAEKEMELGRKFLLPDDLKLEVFRKDNEQRLNKVQRHLSFEPEWNLLLEKFDSDILRALRRETDSLNLPALLRYEDRNAMASSVENRTPFTDYRIVEFVHSIPEHLRFGNGLSKLFLRKYAARFLPEEITSRTDKKGFEAPQSLWMKRIGFGAVTELAEFRLALLDELRRFYERA